VHPLMSVVTIACLVYFGQDVLEPRSRPEAVGSPQVPRRLAPDV
jgi:hypothetical protein